MSLYKPEDSHIHYDGLYELYGIETAAHSLRNGIDEYPTDVRTIIPEPAEILQSREIWQIEGVHINRRIEADSVSDTGNEYQYAACQCIVHTRISVLVLYIIRVEQRQQIYEYYDIYEHYATISETSVSILLLRQHNISLRLSYWRNLYTTEDV